MGIARDSLDDILKMWEQALVALEEYEQRMEPFRDVKLSDQEVAKEILASLPPEKASALLSALADLGKLDQPFPPGDAVEQFTRVNELMADLRKIRDSLHKALDDVVP